jgi:excisionase family DNA binding protein
MSKLLEAQDVADMIGMSKDWIYAEVRADRIPHVRLGRYVRFRPEAIEDWIRRCERGKIPRAN